MQELKIEGFLGIKSAAITLDGVTVIIGPQASGKSVVARLFFFFNEYFADFDELPLAKNEHKKTYDSRKKGDFCKIFPQYAWHDDEFTVEYQNGDHWIRITSGRGSSSLELTTSPSVATSFRQLKIAFQDFSSSYPDDLKAPSFRILREFRNQMAHNSLAHFEHALFVPAARSFYASIREEVFAILSMDEKIDQIIMQFGAFYESAKARMRFDDERGLKGGKGAKHRAYFDKIAKGRYLMVEGRDWIEMERGRIEMSKASSGQQEAFPLLVALSQFPAPGRTLVIEEPEAHLFPTAQVTILEFIVLQAVERQTSIFLTTHSPYLLSALNNLILRGTKNQALGIAPERAKAFSLVDGISQNLIDEETGLISGDYIDNVSDEIYRDFVSILEEDSSGPQAV
ncbi:MAG: AAA family ATPase [Gemmobacter sp.]